MPTGVSSLWSEIVSQPRPIHQLGLGGDMGNFPKGLGPEPLLIAHSCGHHGHNQNRYKPGVSSGVNSRTSLLRREFKTWQAGFMVKKGRSPAASLYLLCLPCDPQTHLSVAFRTSLCLALAYLFAHVLPTRLYALLP